MTFSARFRMLGLAGDSIGDGSGGLGPEGRPGDGTLLLHALQQSLQTRCGFQDGFLRLGLAAADIRELRLLNRKALHEPLLLFGGCSSSQQLLNRLRLRNRLWGRGNGDGCRRRLRLLVFKLQLSHLVEASA